MKMKRFAQRCALGCLSVLASGCDGPVAPEDLVGATAGANDGSASEDGSINRPPGTDGEPTTGRDPQQVDPTESLPGTDPTLDVAPAGCLGGFEDGALELTLDEDVPAVRLAGTGGVLIANGTGCTTSADAPVQVDALTSLRVTGGTLDNAVILDLGEGDWSALLATPESLRIELGSGQNSFVVRGTAGDDLFRHGMRGGQLVLDLVGDGRISAVTEGVTALGMSLGAGDDRLDDLAAFLSAGAGVTPSAANAVSSLIVPLTAFGAEGNDGLLGGSGDDELDGGPGDDVANGLDGNDHFPAAGIADGSDTFNGGPGYDSVSYELRQIDLALNLCLSSGLLGCADGECEACEMSGEAGEGDRLVNIEDVTGGDGDDILRGSDAADALSGGPGDDRLFGLGGSDVLYGQRGQDVLEGGADGDYCDGREGEQIVACEL